MIIFKCDTCKDEISLKEAVFILTSGELTLEGTIDKDSETTKKRLFCNPHCLGMYVTKHLGMN